MRALLLLVAACGGGERKAAPAKGSDAGSTITAELVGCSSALAEPEDPRDLVTPPSVPAPSARVMLRIPRVVGTVQASAVDRNLRRRRGELQQCYDRALVDKPDLGGIVELAFAISARGEVVSATAAGVDAALSRCIADVVKTISFPLPTDNNNSQVTVEVRLENPRNRVRVRDIVTPVRQQRTLAEWTPFALQPLPEEVAPPYVNAVAMILRERMATVENCFDGARGVVRAMLEIHVDGTLKSSRVGGIGDSDIERCIASAVDKIEIVSPGRISEVACDFRRGGDAPLRVSPDGGYNVIELTATEARNRNVVRAIPPRGTNPTVTMLGSSPTVLVVAEPDAPSHAIEYALWWAPRGTTLVAVKASGGAPVFVGMGDSRSKRSATTDKRVVQLHTDNGTLRACIPGVALPETAPLLDPRAMDRVLAGVVAACKATACEPTIVVGTSGIYNAKDLVATTSAARRAGFHQISIGGPACGI